MKKKIFNIITILIIVLMLTGCGGSEKASTSYSDLIGPWQLDSRYVDTAPQSAPLIILDFKKGQEVDIYAYLDSKGETWYNTKDEIPSMSEYTYIETSAVTVGGGKLSYEYKGETISAEYKLNVNSYILHFYIENEDGKIIHELYKTADKSLRP